MKKYIPNLLAWLRVALVIPIVVLITLGNEYQNLAFGVFLLAASTDFFDGRLARRWKTTSTFGAILDVVADKLLTTGALLALLSINKVWLWVVFVITGRVLVVMGLRHIAGRKGVWIVVSQGGKWSTVLQFVAIAAAIIRGESQIGFFFLDEWLMLIAVILTLHSGIMYFLNYREAEAKIKS